MTMDTPITPEQDERGVGADGAPPSERDPAQELLDGLRDSVASRSLPWSARKRAPMPARERWNAVFVTVLVHVLLFLGLRAAMTPAPIRHAVRHDDLQIVYLIAAPPRTPPHPPLAPPPPTRERPTATPPVPSRVASTPPAPASAPHAIRPAPTAPLAAQPAADAQPTTSLTLFNPDGSVHLPPGQIAQGARDPLGRAHRTADRFLPDPPLGKAPTYEFHDVTGRERIATAFHCVANPLTCLNVHHDFHGHLRVGINTIHDDGYDPCPELEQHLANLDPSDTAARDSDMQRLIQTCGDR